MTFTKQTQTAALM